MHRVYQRLTLVLRAVYRPVYMTQRHTKSAGHLSHEESATVTIRIPKSMKSDIRRRAELRGMSVNEFLFLELRERFPLALELRETQRVGQNVHGTDEEMVAIR